VLLVVAFVWIARAARLGLVPALTLAAILLASEPLENSMALGQINQLVLALLGLFVWALASGRSVLGGAALGVATALRMHPALFIGWLAWRGKWRACGVAVVAALACTALGAATVGWAATAEYITGVAPQYGFASLSGQPGNLSLPGWIVATGHGLAPSVPLGAWRVLGLVAALAVLAAAVVVLRPAGAIAPQRLVPELGLVALVLLLITPNTTINHLVFALLPLAVLVDATLREGTPGRAVWLAVALVLIGAIDDYYQHPRLTAGPAVLLAGIKTYGLAMLAVLTLATLRRPAESTVRRPSESTLRPAAEVAR
jgi:alpha-1,2-mannosyltransferase